MGERDEGAVRGGGAGLAVRERPILFSGRLVRAILEGRKSVTRRVVAKSNSSAGSGRWEWLDLEQAHAEALWGVTPGLKAPTSKAPPDYCPECWTRVYPRYEVGDRLWVKETHAIVPRTAYAQSEGVQQAFKPHDDHDAAVYREGWTRSAPGRWRPSIHMPRWASRITLEVTEVRAERLREITEPDCEAEGIPGYTFARGCLSDSPPDPRWKFIELWDSINAARGFGWDANPWVWVIRFETLPPESAVRTDR